MVLKQRTMTDSKREHIGGSRYVKNHNHVLAVQFGRRPDCVWGTWTTVFRIIWSKGTSGLSLCLSKPVAGSSLWHAAQPCYSMKVASTPCAAAGRSLGTEVGRTGLAIPELSKSVA